MATKKPNPFAKGDAPKGAKPMMKPKPGQKCPKCGK